MCGICGFNWEDKDLIQRMMAKLEHRGPDDKGFLTDTDISLGHRRLSIIDLSSKGKNPMSNSENTHYIIYNGEVYNYQEIRDELKKKGYKFKSKTDTEVILNAYIEYGPKCLEKFNGMFAFAIYDTKHKQLFIARDRLGIKPLYYYHNVKDRKFIFASEIKAILEHGIEREVSVEALNTFMSFRFTSGEQTMFRNIFKLPPAHHLTLSGVDIHIERYWTLKENIKKDTEQNFAKKLRDLLESSTRYRMISDVPLGAYLSGGIDSSLIVALMQKQVKKPIKTFSIGFEHSKDSELKYAKKVSEHIGTKHYEVLVENKHLKEIPDMVYHLDEPLGDAAALPTKVISNFAKKKVTVVLAGEGGDELFAGYDRYKIGKIANTTRALSPSFLRKAGSKVLKGISKDTNVNRISRILEANTNAQAYFNVIANMDDKEKEKLLGPINYINTKKDLLGRYYTGFETKQPLNKMLNFDINTVLCDDFFQKADKMTMSHSIEERVPLLDHRIAEFSMTIPAKLKLKGKVGKYILKQAVKDLVPREIIERPKHGYDAPMDRWLQKDLYSQASEFFEKPSHTFYDTKRLLELLTRFRKNKGSYKGSWYASQKLWSMYMFEMWHKIFIENVDMKSFRI